MRKCNLKFTSLFLALVMLVSLVTVPCALASSKSNEITGFVWDVNSIKGIKLANSAADVADTKLLIATYEAKELKSLVSKDMIANVKVIELDSAINLSNGQSAKAFLWNMKNQVPLALSREITNSGETYSCCEIKGASQIVLPGYNADFRTKNAFTLFDSELNENVKASFTISGDVSGLTMLADGTLLATPEANAGTITVNALYGCKTYTKEITLVKGLYEDFEGYSAGDSLIASESGQGWNENYLGTVASDAAGNYLGAAARYEFLQNCVAEDVVVEYDYFYNTEAAGEILKFIGYDNNNAAYTPYYLRKHSNGNVYIRAYVAADGKTSATSTNLGILPQNSWVSIKNIYNFNENTYSLYIEDTCIINNYKFDIANSQYYLKTLLAGAYTDNINVYSGEMYDPYEIKGYETIVLPGDDASFTTNISYSLIDKDTNSAVGGATYAISGDTDGITIDNNGTLTLTNASKAGKLIISATKDGKTYTKEVTTLKGYSTDFEDIDVDSRPSDWSYRYDSTVVAMSDGNKYLKRPEGYAAYSLDSKFEGESVTLEFDTLLYNNVGNEQLPRFLSYINNSGTSTWYNFIGLRNTEVDGVVTQVGLHTNYFDENGNSISDRNFIKYIDNGSVFKTKYVINYVAGTYDLYIDDELILDDYSFPNNGSEYSMKEIHFRTCIDNVHIYTGTKN